jgi:thiol:disulfide interchange protein
MSRASSAKLSGRGWAWPRSLTPAFVLAILLALLPGTARAASSATAPHVRVELLAQPPAELQPSARQLTAGLFFQLDPGWHVYWQNAGDSGEPPQITWHLPPGFSAGPLQFPAPQRLPLGPLMDFGYEKQVLFPIRIGLPPKSPNVAHPGTPIRTLVADVSWLVCRQACIPGKATLTLDVPPAAGQTSPGNPAEQRAFAYAAAHLPRPLAGDQKAVFAPAAHDFTLAVLTGQAVRQAQFFPFDSGIIQNAAPQPLRSLRRGFEITLARDPSLTSAPASLNGVVVLGDGSAYAVHAPPGALPPASESQAAGQTTSAFARAAGLAFLGGMLLNLMPCVFPVLFIKALALVQSSAEERHQMRTHGVVYTLGILVSFWVVVGLLLALRAGGRHLGWGFQFQSPGFIAMLALVLFFFGLSLAGMFDVGLTLTGAGSSLAAQKGYGGSFFTGVLAMVVATPCTAPFMGAAVGFALAQPAGVTLAIFTALGLGLALPYLVLTFQPAWTRLLPRPGAWMELVKQATAIPVFATVIWMVWLFAQSTGANALVGLLAAFLLLAVAGWALGRWPARRASTVAALALLALAIAAPLYALHAFSEPSPGETAASPTDGLAWQAWSPDAVAQAQAAGRPVFVDFTAKWCLSCQVNERVVLDRPEVQDRLRRSGMLLLRADWTRHDERIAHALESLGRSGVPAYALYPGVAGAAPQLLPEVLTAGIVFRALDALRADQPSRSLASAAQPTP